MIVVDNWGWCNGTDAQGAIKGYWGNPDAQQAEHNICTNKDADDYMDGLIGTKFSGWIVVAEQK